ncbi:MFS transporter [Kineococcus sp. SYSU DK003]|uniref:MFS transporter n=1 Tax=Kineococcus sp. SYSU DK003 TaxID=3383124 RepID=UPI003D7C8BEC
MSTSTNVGGKIPRQVWKTALLGGMASYLDGAVLVTAGIAFSLTIDSLGLSAWDIGLLSGLLTGLLAVGALVGGRLGDKFGRRRVLTLDLLVFVVGLALITGAVNVPMLYAGVVLTGLAMGADLPVSISLVAESAPVQHRGRLVAFSQILWGLGPSVALVLNVVFSAAGLSDDLQARLLWAHVLVVAVVVWAARRRLPESDEWLAATRSAADSTDVAVGETGTVDVAKLKLLVPYTLPLVGVGLFYTVGNFSPNTGGQFSFFILTQVAHLPVATVANIMLTIAPLALFLGVVFIKVVDTRLRYPAMLAAGVLGAFAWAIPGIFGLTSTTYLIAFYGALIASGFIGEGLYKVRTQEIFPPLVRSTAQGATIFVCRMGAAGLAVVTPAVASADLGGLLWLLCGFNVLTLLFGVWIMRIPSAPTQATAVPAATGTSPTVTGAAAAPL